MSGCCARHKMVESAHCVTGSAFVCGDFEYFLRYRLSVRFLTDALVEGGPCVQFILDARDRMPPRVRAYTFQCCHFFHDTEKNIDMISVILPLEKICKKIDPIGSRDFWPNLHGFDEQCDCLN